MKTIALSVISAAALALGGSARAADMSFSRAAPPPGAYDWTGVYAGGHIGGGWQTANFQDPSATTNLILCCTLINNLTGGLAVPKSTTSGFLGGAQVGWNYQIGRLVVGSDFDFSGVSLTSNGIGNIRGPFPGSPIAATEAFTAHTDWTATATATVGVARDHWLFYSKAGAAWAHESYTLGFTGPTNGFGPPGLFSFSGVGGDTRVGWTLGTGLAWAFADNWFARVEYDYLYFGSKPEDFTGVINNANAGGGAPLTSPFTFNTNNTLQISQVKFGLNYKFQPGTLFW